MLLFLNKDNVMLGHKNFIQEMKKNQKLPTVETNNIQLVSTY